jgi:hypothetical protein
MSKIESGELTRWESKRLGEDPEMPALCVRLLLLGVEREISRCSPLVKKRRDIYDLPKNDYYIFTWRFIHKDSYCHQKEVDDLGAEQD